LGGFFDAKAKRERKLAIRVKRLTCWTTGQAVEERGRREVRQKRGESGHNGTSDKKEYDFAEG